MKWLSSTFLCFFAIYHSIATADSRNFWVSPFGNQCNITQCQCTERLPCTLDNQLLSKLVAGDSVNLKGGTYQSFIIDNLNGQVHKPIRFIGPSQGLPAYISGQIDGARDVIEIRQSSHIWLENLKVSGAIRAGIRVNNSHYVTVNNNELFENGVWGIFTNHANNFTARFNKIIGPAKEHGIYQSNSGDNVTIFGNFIVNFNGCAVHFNGDLSMGGASEVAGDGIISNIVVSNNFLAGNGLSGGSAVNLDGVDGAVIDNNLIINNFAAGVTVFKQNGAYISKNIHIEKNLIIMNPHSRAAIIFSNSNGNNTVNSNVIIAQHSWRGIYEVADVTSRKYDRVFSSNNNYYSFRKNFSNFMTFKQWQDNGRDLTSQVNNVQHYLLSLDDVYNITIPTEIEVIMVEKNIAQQNIYLEKLLN